MKKALLYFLVLSQILFFYSCKNKSENSSQYPSGKDISIHWKLLENNYKGTDYHRFLLTLENKSSHILDNKNWELFFSHSPCRPILEDSVPSGIKVTHINGDYFKITPTEKFTPMQPGASMQIPLLSEVAVIKYTDAPRGFYFIFTDPKGNKSQPEIAAYTIDPFENYSMLSRGKTDIFPVPTPELSYDENASLNLIPEKELPLIIPTPLKAKYNDETISITSDFQIHYTKDLKEEAEFLSSSLNILTGNVINISESSEGGNNVILLQKQNLPFSKSEEAYTLSITKDGITITGNNKAGVFYGIQSLRAILPIEAYAKPTSPLIVRTASIEDAPQFEYRGMQLDVVRHFHEKESILKLIDVLSLYKINKFRMHIGDDEGWRLEIKELPELTEVSSKRGHTLDESTCLIPSYGSGPKGELAPSNGFYTRKDFEEILRYAKQRHIDIIPAIDIPGHARAAIKAMDVRYNTFLAKGDTIEARKFLLRDLNDKSVYSSVQLFNDNVVCPCEDGIYNFLETIFDDIKGMYSEAGANFTTIHIGGDEVAEGVWTKSPACEKFKASHPDLTSVQDLKKYFFNKVNEIVHKEGLITSSYEDITMYKEGEESGKTEIKIREDFPKSKMQIYVWNNVWGWGTEDMSYRLANAGYPVVLSNVTNLYFDLSYNKDPEEPGLYWGGFNSTKKPFEFVPFDIYKSAYIDRFGNPISEDMLKNKVRLTAKGKSNIKGIEGLLWSETLKGQDMMEWYTFPKVIALAERAWATAPQWSTVENKEERIAALNKDWNIFANALGQRELPRLDYLDGGLNYMLPVPGVKSENGKIFANVAFPGLIIRYTTDGSEPSSTSPVYSSGMEISGQAKFASCSKKGRLSRIAAIK